jgi:hypothetical protein
MGIPSLEFWISSSTGLDSNPGTEASPFKTIAFFQTLAANNDTVNLLGGDTFTETNTFTGLSGLTFQSYGSGQAKLQPTPSATNIVLIFQDCGGITLENLDVSSPALISPTTNDGQRVIEFLFSTGAEQSNFLINNCTIHDALGGVVVANQHTSQATVVVNNFQFTNNTCFNLMCRGACETSGSNSASVTTYMYTNGVISGNVISNFGGVSQTNLTGFLVQSGSGWTISGNQVSNIGTALLANTVGIEFGQCSGCSATGNVINGVFTNTTKLDGDGMDFDLNTVGCTFDGNVISNCDGAGILFFSNSASGTPNVASNNLIINCGNKNGYTPLYFRNTFAGVAFGNTVEQITSTTPCLSADVTADAAGYKAYNNIFYNASGPCVNLPTAASGLDLEGNAYGSGSGFSATYNGTNYTTLAAWRTATGFETGSRGFSLTGNPCIAPSPVPTITLATLRLAYDYSLAAGSPLLGGGLNLTSLFGITLPATDLLGNAISPTNLSVGAINIVKPPAYTWEFIQANAGSTVSDSLPVAFGAPVKSGHFIVVGVTVGGFVATATVTDSLGNTYTQDATVGTGAFVFHAKVTTGGANTVTALAAGGSGGAVQVAIAEYAPPPGATTGFNTPATTGTGTGTAVSLASLTITPLDLSTMLVRCSGVTTEPTAGSGWTARAFEPGTASNTATYYQDQLSSTASPITATATLPTSETWQAAAATYLASSLPPYSMIGPIGAQVGTAAPFFLVPNGTPGATDTISMATSGSGTFSPTSLAVTESPADIPFTYTPSAAGPVTLTFTSANSLTIGAGSFVFAGFDPFTLTGPSGGTPGAAVTLTLTPAAATTDTITFTLSGLSGTFSPTSLTWSNSAAAQSTQFTPSAIGSGTITATSADGAPITGSPLSFLVGAMLITPQISKWGLLVIPITQGSGEVNGYFPILTAAGSAGGLPLIAVNSNPSLFMNGNPVSLNGPIWTDITSESDGSIAAWYPQCGTVMGVTAQTGGENYTTASATWTSGSGGGSSLTLGTPVLGQGVTSYAFTPGSGLTNGTYQVAIPGGTFVSEAQALVTVAGGVVTSVVPLCGSWFGMGAGYTVVPPVFTFSGATPATGGPVSPTITPAISGYVQSVPVTASSNDFTSLPTITITGNGTGATVTSFMSGPPAGATMTMSLAAGAFDGNGGTSLAFPLGSIPNYAGQTEPYFANITPAIPYGGEFGGQMYPFEGPLFLAKNKLLAALGWGAGVTTDSNGFPISGTPGVTINNQFYFGSNRYNCPAVGTWTIIYNDTHAGVSGATTVSISSHTGATVQTPPTVVSISGTLVTLTQTVEAPVGTGSNDLGLFFNVTWPTSGTWNLSNIRILAPNNIDTYDTNPLDVDDVFVAALTGPTGSTPGTLRDMDCIFGPGGVSNYIIPADYPFPSPYTGIAFLNFATAASPQLLTCRFLNTNPSDTTHSWSSPLLYVWTDEVVGGTDPTFGNNKYIDMRLGPNGANDMGAISALSKPQDVSAIEFTTAAPHGLKTLNLVQMTFNNNIPGTVSISNGSTALTTTSSTPNIGPGNQITITGDSSGGTYSVVSGSGTSWVITPAFGGTTISGANCQAVPVLPFSVTGNVAIFATFTLDLAVYVTGPNSFFIYWNLASTLPTNPIQFVDSTEQFATGSLKVTLPLPWGSAAPFEFAASAVARFPGTIFHHHLSCVGSNAFHQLAAQRIAPYMMNTNNPIYIELYDEPWNGGSPGFGQSNSRARWAQYVPTGTVCYNGYWTANGEAVPASPAFSTAAAYKTFTEELISLGISASRFKVLYSSQSTVAAGTGGVTANAIQTYSLPGSTASGIPGALVQNNYAGCGNGNTIEAAFQPAGYPGAGNWPIWMINDWNKWYIAYGSFYQYTLYADLNAAILNNCPELEQGIYEGGLTEPVLLSVIDEKFKSNDCMSHSSWADAVTGVWKGAQLGAATVSGSGVKFASDFSLWSIGGNPGAFLYCLSEGPAMVTGSGTSNKFFTPQGGAGSTGLQPQGYAATNQAPGILALQEFNTAAQPPPDPSGGGASPGAFLFLL